MPPPPPPLNHQLLAHQGPLVKLLGTSFRLQKAGAGEVLGHREGGDPLERTEHRVRVRDDGVELVLGLGHQSCSRPGRLGLSIPIRSAERAGAKDTLTRGSQSPDTGRFPAPVREETDLGEMAPVLHREDKDISAVTDVLHDSCPQTPMGKPSAQSHRGWGDREEIRLLDSDSKDPLELMCPPQNLHPQGEHLALGSSRGRTDSHG